MTRRTWRCSLAVLLALAFDLAQAQGLGRLLMDPGQRAELARARGALASGEGGVPMPPSSADSGGETTPAAAAPQRIEGWVLRGGGRSTVWVDGVPYYGFDANGPTRDALARRGLLARDAGRPGSLRAQPGQSVDGASRRTTDLLPEGALRIRRHPAAPTPAR